MRITPGRSILLPAIAVVALAGTAIAAGQVVGIAAAVRNQVSIRPGGGGQPQPVAVRQRVALGDQIETGARSQLQLMLLDKSTFTIGANARLTIDRFVYDPQKRSLAATVAKGAFRFMSGRADRGGEASIKTPVSTIGIRGTILEGAVGSEAVAIAGREPALNARLKSDPESASLIVLRGPGAGTRLRVAPGSITVSGANGTIALDRPMMAAYVPEAGAAPIGPFTISPDGLRRLEALVFNAQAEELRSSGGGGDGGFKAINPYSSSPNKPPWAAGAGGAPLLGPGGFPPGGPGATFPTTGGALPAGGAPGTPGPPPGQGQPKQVQPKKVPAQQQQQPGQPGKP